MVKLPVAGRIWEIMTAAGEDVRAGQPLARVLDCSSTVVTANVTERVYNQLQIGAPARFQSRRRLCADINGTVVNLTGAAGAAANLAISPDALSKEPYRVTVSMPQPRLRRQRLQGRADRPGDLRKPARRAAMIDALSPGLIAFGLWLAAIPWLRRDNTVARSALAVVSVVLLLHYWWWRVSETVPPPGLTADFSSAAFFMLAETAALVAGASVAPVSVANDAAHRRRSTPISDGSHRERHSSMSSSAPTTKRQAILERTIIGATGMRYPNYRVWVLDDGRRGWLQQLADAARLPLPDASRQQARQGRQHQPRAAARGATAGAAGVHLDPGCRLRRRRRIS